MLINIDPILSPKLLSTLRSMGHGDRLILADANFPATSLAKRLIRLDGINIPNAAKAILSVFPIDSFISWEWRSLSLPAGTSSAIIVRTSIDIDVRIEMRVSV